MPRSTNVQLQISLIVRPALAKGAGPLRAGMREGCEISDTLERKGEAIFVLAERCYLIGLPIGDSLTLEWGHHLLSFIQFRRLFILTLSEGFLLYPDKVHLKKTALFVQNFHSEILPDKQDPSDYSSKIPTGRKRLIIPARFLPLTMIRFHVIL